MTSRPAQPTAAAISGQAGDSLSAPTSDFRFPASLSRSVERSWRKAAVPAEWNLPREEFESALARSVARRFSGERPGADAIESYLETLHHADLALACACGSGNDVAWEFFVARFRQELYRAARAITGSTRGGESDAKELADSLYADLYGLRQFEGQRRSLFDYFHGRSKLSTWLRAILAQRHVDTIRRSRRLEPLQDGSGRERTEISVRAAGASLSGAPGASAFDAPDPDRAKYVSILQAALADALARLEPRDRLRLAYYYTDERTLADIGRLLGEHEATVSRKLDRTRRRLRETIEVSLRKGKGLSDAEMRLCYEYARQEWPFDLTTALGPEGASSPAGRL